MSAATEYHENIERRKAFEVDLDHVVDHMNRCIVGNCKDNDDGSVRDTMNDIQRELDMLDRKIHRYEENLL